ncbi:MAG TPA: efflux RND transporter periplasmic adaptor subunit [Paenalcaligenes hominis]|uniref:Efflux RND transporter periplasmic adaptor subunit n=1 Tax=Paenalcaligenes hominis TaxID=643674 RepID=A0A9D2VI43_9BURK|nr:efflux RND transporter periplasmic adaptor subunit [Paenalcaligenes hominis]NJB64437.1 membrane fusion protein (multidrug efflux system) [Paenalcaligenes hominis]GGE67659.1 MexX family efflux pump subunit [Paenalcaligenes hominis]HJH25112.1 efflux RND transporter periplasmic adaptor subunit [Paenalcaligenes hominis]
MSNVRRVAWHPLRVVLISATLLVAACGEKPQQQDMAGMKIPVSVVQVQPEVTPIFVELPGRVEAIEEAQVRARVNGVVEAINFEQGAEVKEGDLLFTIDSAPYVAARDQALAQVRNAEAAAKTANSLAQRYGKLIKENAISRQEYDNAMAEVQQSRANIELAKAGLKTADINLGYTKVTAPISGRIGKAEITKGALVSATQATHLATIQRIDELYVDISRPVGEVLAIRKAITEGKLKADDQGQAPVKAIFDDRSEYAEQGKLLFSGVAVDPSTGQLNMRALFPNPNHDLLPGMFVRVRLEQAISENALLVPTQAVQYATSGAASLMVVEEGVVKAVPVKLGSQVDGRIMVTEGLEPGATVIVAGFQKIRPGAPVQPMPWQDGADSETPAASTTADNG